MNLTSQKFWRSELVVKLKVERNVVIAIIRRVFKAKFLKDSTKD